MALRLLLLLHPRAFRRRYGAELRAAYTAMRAEPRYAGIAGRLAFWVDVLRDVVPSASRGRAARLRARFSDRPISPASPGRRTEMDTVLHDIRQAIRSFAHRPGFAAVAVLSFALAIGANTAVYGVLDGFVFNPFPYPQPDRLVAVGVTFPRLSSETRYIEILSPAEYHDIRTDSRSFASIGGFDLGNRNITGGDVPERVFTGLLLDDLFPVLGVPPALGRGFTAEELAPGGPPAAIISHRLWQSRFGGDPGILNRPVRIDGRATSVVGVMAPGVVLIGTDLWIPWGGNPADVPRNARQFNILARLAPGTTLGDANAELAAIAGRVEAAERARFAEYEGWRLVATPWAAALLQDVRPAAFLLLGAVGLVLLIACANLANLFLARATTRQRELAVRLALGAARWRIARHLLTEALLLAIAGAGAGLFIAYAAFRSAGALIPAQFQMLGLEAGFNPRVLVWSAGLALVSAAIVALLPMVHAARTDPHDSLKSDARVGAARGGRARQAFVVAEIAISVVLLLGAGLLLRTMQNIQRVDPGFNPDGVVTMRLTLPRGKYQDEAANAFFDSLIERLSALPGVSAVAAASQFPPLGSFQTQFSPPQAGADSSTLPTALITVSTPEYFRTLGVPLRAGRSFEASDTLAAPPVAIVNEAFVSRYLQGEPLGQRILIGSPTRQRAATVVGVVTDHRNTGPAQPVRPEIHIPMRQQTAWNQLFVLVRSAQTADAVVPAVRQTVVALDSDQPVYAIQTLRSAMSTATFQQQLTASLLGIFAAVALVVAAIGIYGVLSYAVSARTRELGVRLALGARPREVLWLVIRQVLVLAAIGLALGLAALAAGGRAMEGLLLGVSPLDPLTIGAVSLVLGAAALGGAWVPASRASRIDPVEALRCE